MPSEELKQALIVAALLPPGNSIALFLLGILLPPFRKIFWLLGFAALYLFATPTISGRLMELLETSPPIALEKLSAEAIVVLGADRRHSAAEYGGHDTIYRLGLERIRYAAKLAKETKLPLLASGGGIKKTEQTPSEADLMKEVLEEFGVEPRWLEGESRNTYENAQNSSRILKGLGISEVILVTHGWHMPRAKEAFEKAGLRVIPAPLGDSIPNPPGQQTSPSDWIPSAKSMLDSSWAMHELIGRIWYHQHYYRQGG